MLDFGGVGKKLDDKNADRWMKMNKEDHQSICFFANASCNL